MVRINKVYTRTGDKGQTRLAGGQTIAKDSLRIEAYGTVDELNATLGLICVLIAPESQFTDLQQKTTRIQNELFNLGSQLAVLPEDRRDNTPVIGEPDITRLEKEIDQMNDQLPPLTSFILPGGGEAGARFHLARTVCRRAERQTIRLQQEEQLDGTEVPYLNRLSDWLFVAGRYAAMKLGVDEALWTP